jgi:hypothetical protein
MTADDRTSDGPSHEASQPVRILAVVVALGTGATVILSLLVWAARGLEPLPVSFGRTAIGVGGLVVAPICYVAMGAIIVGRVSRNPIGWLFLVAGVALGTMLPVNLFVTTAHEALRPAPDAVVWVAWFRNTFATPVAVTTVILAIYLFPTGSLPARRWRIGIILTVVAGIVLAATAAADPQGMVSYPSLANPTAAPLALARVVHAMRMVAVGLMGLSACAAIVSVVVRYRGGDALVRAQLRWIVLAATVTAVAGIPFLLSRYLVVVPDQTGELLSAAAQIGSAGLPIATAIAISRYRLFGIDVLLGHTLVYLPLTAILGGLYTASIAFFQRLFVAVTGETSDTAIVLTVLVVAAAFTPARHALEGLVERRFAPPRGAGSGHIAISPNQTRARPASYTADLTPSVLVPIASDGTVACPRDGTRNAIDCLGCAYLQAIVRHPGTAVVCSPPHVDDIPVTP